MGKNTKAEIAAIFEQLRLLRERITVLESAEASQVVALRGRQTLDTQDAITLSFHTLQSHIASMEETLATLAEATGDSPKL